MSFLVSDASRLPFGDDSFDLVFGSPPYCDARTYGIGAQRECSNWIDWMLKVTEESVRVSRGLVIWICAGVTRCRSYQPGPEGLLYEWWKRGGRCWRPAYWNRVGIPGSGGKQWLRADVEYALCFTKCQGAIPWSDNTANGHPPRWATGGEMSYRNTEGNRKNESAGPKASARWKRDKWGGTDGASSGEGRDKDGKRKTRNLAKKNKRIEHAEDGTVKGDHDRLLNLAIANPGVLIKGIKVGGGLMGSPMAHKNEAPFPLKLAQWFIRGWAPPSGRVLDPFSGSGTTVHAAMTLGRIGIGCDIRLNQCHLGRRRCAEIQTELFQ